MFKSHKEGLEKYGSIEGFSKKTGIPEEVINNKLDIEKEFNVKIAVPEYFESYFDARNYFEGTKRIPEWADISYRTAFRRVQMEKKTGAKYQLHKDGLLRDSEGNIITRYDDNSIITDTYRARKKALATELDLGNIEDIKNLNILLNYEPTPPPKWISNTDKLNIDEFSGTPVLLVTDIHMGEVVDPTEINGLNKYNSDIAVERMSKVTNKTVDLLTKHMKNTNYPGIVVCLAGDLVNGEIHDELKNTNDITLNEAIIKTYECLYTMISTFKDVFNNVTVISVPGNHGRNTKKVEHKNVAKNNADWLIVSFLEQIFKDDPEVSIINSISEGYFFDVHGHRFVLIHKLPKNATTTGGPYAKILSSSDSYRRDQVDSIGGSYDTALVGHYHMYMSTPQVICGGSVVGYTQYAMKQGYRYERPTQALFLVHPKYGITFNWALYLNE